MEFLPKELLNSERQFNGFGFDPREMALDRIYLTALEKFRAAARRYAKRHGRIEAARKLDHLRQILDAL